VQRGTNLDRFLAMGFPLVEVPFLPNFPAAGSQDREFRAEGKRRTAAAGFAARFAGAADRTFALPADEPNPRTYDDLVRASGQLRSVNPRIPIVVTEAPHPEALAKLGNAVDIYLGAAALGLLQGAPGRAQGAGLRPPGVVVHLRQRHAALHAQRADRQAQRRAADARLAGRPGGR
jgi:hypothetical protein